MCLSFLFIYFSVSLSQPCHLATCGLASVCLSSTPCPDPVVCVCARVCARARVCALDYTHNRRPCPSFSPSSPPSSSISPCLLKTKQTNKQISIALGLSSSLWVPCLPASRQALIRDYDFTSLSSLLCSSSDPAIHEPEKTKSRSLLPTQ